ncbi:MAG: cell division protein SepF [Candidatus Eremiobacteraeota bacterium]|nr:cell division protein SepF [Candidatus Eremiobacteraeota bacterium]MBV8366888.1 cell division protein SepF [Candidatus Eremiobacteraeota bacterium]
MGLWSNIVSSMGFRDADDLDDEIFDEEGKPKLVPINDARGARKIGVSVFRPRQYDEVSDIADNLRARLLVVVNLVGADRALSQRVIDFLSGVVYTLDGKMQRLSEGIFLFVPSNVQVNSNEPELAASGSYDSW